MLIMVLKEEEQPNPNDDDYFPYSHLYVISINGFHNKISLKIVS